jgi:cytochrome P450
VDWRVSYSFPYGLALILTVLSMAGADSTSIALRAIFYFLMKDPEKLNKVRAEVDAAFANGTLSHPVQYNAAITLPYLRSVIKEATRIFPSFQTTMPRHAPVEGIELCGHHIPAGYRIGMNPYVLHRVKSVFGEDAADFRPERWLGSEEHTRAMEKASIGFGAGTRQCTGKNVSFANMYCIRFIQSC